MKSFNLRTLKNAKNNITLYSKYLGTKFKKQEIEDIISFIKMLDDNTRMDGYFFGFIIPQINKEFDLLRFSKKGILNIELKSQNVEEERIKKQLIKNKYYLDSFQKGKKVYLYTYISQDNSLFSLDCSNSLKKADFNDLAQKMNEPLDNVNPRDLCNVNDYLISPFNETQRFIEGKFYLTQQQQKIEKDIIKKYNNNNHYIEGNPGTGKTLLAYTIAKDYIESGKKVIIIHCANLNNGQIELNNSNFDIIPIKNLKLQSLKDYDIMIIDEVQRMQFSEIKSYIHTFKGQIICCGDEKQWINNNKEKENAKHIFHNLDSEKFRGHKLSEKIRSNKEISSFIKHFYNLKYKDEFDDKSEYNFKNVFVEYFDDKNQAILFSQELNQSGWKIINNTPSIYHKEPYGDLHQAYFMSTSHEVIGQEFDKVATFIGDNLKYKNSKLISSGTYYPTVQTLFQNLTRARKKLYLIIINNSTVFNECLRIINL